MKKFVTLVLSVLLLVSLAACAKDDKPELVEDHTMYLITDLGTIDDKSFNQGSYEGLEQYAHEIGVTPNYVKPTGDGNMEDYLEAIESAIDKGAKVVVTPGFLFETAIYVAQEKHPDVMFILVDATPKSPEDGSEKIATNTLSILYHEEQSGYLAGYAAVKSGLTNLGFMGGIAVPAVINYGYGYLAGADAAAEELGVKIDVRYTYLGGFIPDTKHQTQASAWYNDGVEAIFASAGGAGNSVMAAAEETDKFVIGVDVDQHDESDTIITSAMKNLKGSVYEAVKAAKTGSFEGGKALVLGAKDNGIGLPSNFDRLENFKQADYDKVYAMLKDNTDNAATNIPTLATHGDDASTLQFKNIDLTVVE